MPDFSNMSLTEANNLAAELSLNICIEGSHAGDSGAYVKEQDIEKGTSVEIYTVVTLTFNQDNSIM